MLIVEQMIEICTIHFLIIGLCNSRRIDKLLARYLRTRTDCDVCHEGAKKVLRWFRQMDKDDVLDKGLAMCGQYMSSYSDACKLSLLENFDDLYRWDIRKQLKIYIE